FAADGIDLRLGHEAVRFETEGDERVLVAEHDGREVRLPFDAVLVAVGRKARLKGIGLEALGIDCDKTVEADDFLRTSVPNIYAAGDVAGPWQFTHTAAYQAWYAAVNALFDPFWTLRISGRVIPAATFTEPEVARVGINEREAKERKIEVEVTRYALADLDRAIADGATEGFVKVLTPPGKDKILGVTIVGEDAGNLIAEYVLAMKHGLGLGKVLGTIHVYPTLAEANKNVAAEWRKAHAPQRLLDLSERFHAWRRG
ncbi:MAG: FAD-dependent oxidoreductase, partial [Caldimonas sp.]